MKQKKEIIITLLLLFLFGTAFGYIEGAAAHYLRMHYYPEGFTFHLKAIENHVLIIEMGREISTLIVIFVIAWFSASYWNRRLFNFLMIFGIWDIVYYLALFLFEAWPESVFNWDILFLVPVPWFAPVIAPVTISLLWIATNIVLYIVYSNSSIKIGVPAIIIFILSILLWQITFVCYRSYTHFPEQYNWFLFITGCFFWSAGTVKILFKKLYIKV